jgi:trk system potassium uptake protein TrkH
MHFAIIARVLGMLLVIFSLTMLTPVLVAFIYGENTSPTFVLAFAITLIIGMIFWLPSRGARGELRTRDGFVVTVFFWLVLSSFGALPLMLSEALHLSFIDALFESVSGLTTTGATVIAGLDNLPKSILYYRQQLQWLGRYWYRGYCCSYSAYAGCGWHADLSRRNPWTHERLQAHPADY